MMSGVDELSLSSIGASIESPFGEQADGVAGPPQDRLEEFAAWWTRVAASAGPKRAEWLWAPDVPFDAPAAIDDLIPWAIAAADRAIDGGADVVMLGVPATGAIAPSVLAARLLRLDAVDAAGWPAISGESDVSWVITVTTIRDGLRRVQGRFSDDVIDPEPAELLRRLDDRWLAAGCAAVLRSASRRTPLILEGFGAAVSGLFAWHLNPASAGWWLPADGPVLAMGFTGVHDGLHDRVLAAMQKEPLVRLGLSHADGTAGRIALAIVEAALERAKR
jgi:nicotinate-nucleotide--dimethylbenzimidazole phosphoribosyltransferase